MRLKVAVRFPPSSVQASCTPNLILRRFQKPVWVRMETPAGGGLRQTALRTLLERDFPVPSAA